MAEGGVPVSELSVEQLGGLQKQVETELAFFDESCKQLKSFMSKTNLAITSLTQLSDAKPGHEALIPLCESMYVRAALSDPSRTLVEIGTGYFAEMDREKAKELFERKKNYIASQVETIEKILVDKKRTRNILSETMQSKIQTQLASMPPKANMRPDPVSICETNFILDGLRNDERLDGRRRDDFRQVKLVVGAQCGTALATMGSTKVLCSVSASLTEPSRARPQKGIVQVDVDMSPMGNPSCEHNRLGEKGMDLTRLLERVIRDSRCIDVESLCVRAHKEVWRIRVDVRVLDDDGALLDCASIAAVAALQHFRRQDVTLEPHHTIVHTEWEKALIPLNIYHMPICVSFGFINNGTTMVMDPCEREEHVVSGCLVVACNKRKEVCALHQSTNLILTTEMIESCVRLAMRRVSDLSELVATVIHDDAQKRAKYTKPDGFEVTVNAELLTSLEAHPNELVAPALELSAPQLSAVQQPSVVVNEEPLGLDRAIKMDEEEDQKVLETQVEQIALSHTAATSQFPVEEKKVKTVRQQDAEDAADLLDDLDDLMGETTELTPATTTTTTTSVEPQNEDIDLLAAKKKRKAK